MRSATPTRPALAGENLITVVYFGDGATSESDFHSAMNFAGLWKTPTVFLCSNNGWAISMPVRKQTAAAALADKAVGYGMPGMQVDGMDVLAVYSATREAVERARSGGGPTMIEAVTYRYGPHATADDPTLYRSTDELTAWRARDPIDRFKRFLVRQDLWSDDIDEQVTERGVEVRRGTGGDRGLGKASQGRRPSAMSTLASPRTWTASSAPLWKGRGSPPSRIGRGEVRRTGPRRSSPRSDQSLDHGTGDKRGAARRHGAPRRCRGHGGGRGDDRGGSSGSPKGSSNGSAPGV